VQVYAVIPRKRALEECVIHHIAFAAFTTYHPVTAPHLPQPSVRLDRHRHRALIRVYQQWPMCSKESHKDFVFLLIPIQRRAG
jgi:hypothetical protein